MDWYREGLFKKKRFGCQANKENGAGQELNGGGLSGGMHGA